MEKYWLCLCFVFARRGKLKYKEHLFIKSVWKLNEKKNYFHSPGQTPNWVIAFLLSYSFFPASSAAALLLCCYANTAARAPMPNVRKQIVSLSGEGWGKEQENGDGLCFFSLIPEMLYDLIITYFWGKWHCVCSIFPLLSCFVSTH